MATRVRSSVVPHSLISEIDVKLFSFTVATEKTLAMDKLKLKGKNRGVFTRLHFLCN
jgi:hypothetical protein